MREAVPMAPDGGALSPVGAVVDMPLGDVVGTGVGDVGDVGVSSALGAKIVGLSPAMLERGCCWSNDEAGWSRKA